MIKLCKAVLVAETICASTSSLVPLIPTGSLIPPCASTINSLGITCKISLDGGIETVLALSIALKTSSVTISSCATATTPLLLVLVICFPLIETYTEETVSPAILSAASSEAAIELIASSILTITPFLTPLLG